MDIDTRHQNYAQHKFYVYVSTDAIADAASCSTFASFILSLEILTQHVCNTSSDWTVGKSSGSKMTIYVPQLLRQNAVDSLAQLSR